MSVVITVTESLLRRGALAIAAAILANGLVVGVTAGTIGTGAFEPLGIVPVSIATAVGALGGTVVYAGFRRAFPEAADRRFVLLAAGVTVLSFGMLPGATEMDGATTARLVVLGLTHVVAAIATVGVLVDRTAL